MVITKTPFRMSFFGGGTDMPDFFNEYPGAVISTTFDKYCYVNARHLPRFFDYTTELSYQNIERVTNINNIVHPLIRNAMQMLYMHEMRLGYEADLPARSGLGTSSSFAVGLINAFYAMKGQYVDKRRLADEAIYVERTLCNEAGGWQDQIAAAFGGFNRIDFYDNTYDVTPIIMPHDKKETLNRNLIMFFTGFTRFSAAVQVQNSGNKSEKIILLKQMRELVDEAYKILTNADSDLNDFGRLMDETWRLKRCTGPTVSTDEIDELYAKAMQNGAYGGKLLGAGSGGFLLFYVPEEEQEKFRQQFPNHLFIPFRFENAGTQIIHYTEEIYDSQSRREEN